jgi:hypothetical protein
MVIMVHRCRAKVHMVIMVLRPKPAGEPSPDRRQGQPPNCSGCLLHST